MLEEGGILERSPEGLVVARTGETDRASPDPGDLPDTLLERHPWGAAELGLVGRCGAALGDVLRGRAEPLELLSGGGSSGAAALRHESPLARAMHRVVGDAVEALVEALPVERRLRVLAIGAGGAREAIRAALPEGRAACVYAEASGDTFPDRSAASSGSRVLDLERDPVAQGFEAHGYDVVIAANVLHATRDLGEALGHLRALLAPSGTLVALEGLRRQGWLDLTFGLLDGWWRYADEYRTDGALAGEVVWRRALSDAGLRGGGGAVVGGGGNSRRHRGARSGGRWSSRKVCGWSLRTGGTSGGRLAEALAARNQRVVVAGEAVSWSGGEALPGVRVAHVEPVRREAWRSLVEELAGDGTLRGVVHLSGLDGCGEEATAEALGEDAEHGYSSALALTQGLLDADIAPAAGVWFVTRGAQMVSREQGGVLAGAALWGFSPHRGAGGAEARSAAGRPRSREWAGRGRSGRRASVSGSRDAGGASRGGASCGAAGTGRGDGRSGVAAGAAARGGSHARRRHVPGDRRSRRDWARGGGVAREPGRGRDRAQRAPPARSGGGGGDRSAPLSRGDGGGRACGRVGRRGGRGDARAHRRAPAAAGGGDPRRRSAGGRGAGEPGPGAVRAGHDAEDAGGVASASRHSRTGARPVRAVLERGRGARQCGPGELRGGERVPGPAGGTSPVAGSCGSGDRVGGVVGRGHGGGAAGAARRAAAGRGPGLALAGRRVSGSSTTSSCTGR